MGILTDDVAYPHYSKARIQQMKTIGKNNPLPEIQCFGFSITWLDDDLLYKRSEIYTTGQFALALECYRSHARRAPTLQGHYVEMPSGEMKTMLLLNCRSIN